MEGFTLQQANWLAHFLQPSGVPPIVNLDATETFQKLSKLVGPGIYTQQHARFQLAYSIKEAAEALSVGRYPGWQTLRSMRHLLRDVPWIAFIIPGGRDWKLEQVLSNPVTQKLMQRDNPGLILPLDQDVIEGRYTELDNVVPVFRVVLANATRWPGVVIWTSAGDAGFFPIQHSFQEAFSRFLWLFRHIDGFDGSPSVLQLLGKYESDFSQVEDVVPLRILHLSDIHLGSRVAQRRLPRVKQLIEQIAAELGEHIPIVPIVTGDIMDTPDDANLDSVRDFLAFLNSVGSEDPVLILGNHDVRKDGWLSSDLQYALRIQTDRVRWFDQSRVGLACFNSVRSGHLARGHIDETEMMDVGMSLDERRNKADVIAALLHHHPVPVELPAWYRQEWWERFLGGAYERTEALENSDQFLTWLRARRIGLILHGHKHIPRVDTLGNLMVVGCGSSVGKVKTQEQGGTYMSINIVTIDVGRGRLSCRLRAERIPGGGLTAEEQHEAIITVPLQ